MKFGNFALFTALQSLHSNLIASQKSSFELNILTDLKKWSIAVIFLNFPVSMIKNSLLGKKFLFPILRISSILYSGWRQTIGCEIGCETGCEKDWEIGCVIGCELGCEIGCEIGCETGCEIGCETGCEIGCEIMFCEVTGSFKDFLLTFSNSLFKTTRDSGLAFFLPLLIL